MLRPAFPLRSVIAGSLVAAGLMALPSSSVADEKPGRQPGLPYVECTAYPDAPCFPDTPDVTDDYAWAVVTQNGQTGSTAAKQWAQIPSTVVALNATFALSNLEPGPGEVSVQSAPAYGLVWFVSPRDSKDNYGDSSYIPVRTLAFGSIPVEVTLQVSQRRDKNNLPIPITANTVDERRELPDGTLRLITRATTISEKLNVRVRKVVVDGVNVGLKDSCQTGPVASLEATSEEREVVQEPGWTPPEGSQAPSKADQEYDPALSLSAIKGGTLRGSITVPAFRGCRTRTGDDLSPLLTSAVSSRDNPITLQIGAFGCTTYETSGLYRPIVPKPGTRTKDLTCLDDFPYNPKITTKPAPLPIPDYAPGEQPPE